MMLFNIFSVKKTFVFVLCIPIYITLLYGCAHVERKSYPQGPLEEVAALYWTKRLVDKDYKFTYNMELEKDSITFSDYWKKVKTAGKIKFLSVEIKDVEKDKDKASVIYVVKYQVLTAPIILERPIHDEWVFKGDRWLHKLKKK